VSVRSSTFGISERPLAAAVDIGADNVGLGAGALAHVDEVSDPGLDPRLKASSVSVAPVEHLVFVEDDWHAQAVRPDVGDERLELLALHQREHAGERVGTPAPVRIGPAPRARQWPSLFWSWALLPSLVILEGYSGNMATLA
jgi:hypothetical protein